MERMTWCLPMDHLSLQIAAMGRPGSDRNLTSAVRRYVACTLWLQRTRAPVPTPISYAQIYDTCFCFNGSCLDRPAYIARQCRCHELRSNINMKYGVESPAVIVLRDARRNSQQCCVVLPWMIKLPACSRTRWPRGIKLRAYWAACAAVCAWRMSRVGEIRGHTMCYKPRHFDKYRMRTYQSHQS